MTANDMLIPVGMLSLKAAPKDRPSIKLWKPSPKMIIHAKEEMADSPDL
jgi:hypothetical protein